MALAKSSNTVDQMYIKSAKKHAPLSLYFERNVQLPQGPNHVLIQCTTEAGKY